MKLPDALMKITNKEAHFDNCINFEILQGPIEHRKNEARMSIPPDGVIEDNILIRVCL
jgi:hypothetical protein